MKKGKKKNHSWKYGCYRFIRSHPFYCFLAALGRRRGRNCVRWHARCVSLNLINKYVLFYDHFLPTMQTHFPWRFHCLFLLLLIVFWRFASMERPTQFVSEGRITGNGVLSCFASEKVRLPWKEGKKKNHWSFLQPACRTNLLWLQ